MAFSEKKVEHLNMLKKLWAKVFPERKWESVEGDHWKLMGFQVSQQQLQQLHFYFLFREKTLQQIFELWECWG